jgi:hypothetical protein
MIKLGALIIECDGLKVDPDSFYRHEIVHALMPYYVADQREKMAKNKQKNNLTRSATLCYAMNVADNK